MYNLYPKNCWRKGLKIPKEYSKSVNRRMIDNTIAKRKKENRTKMIYSIITQKTKDRATGTPLNSVVEFGCSGRVSSS